MKRRSLRAALAWQLLAIPALAGQPQPLVQPPSAAQIVSEPQPGALDEAKLIRRNWPQANSDLPPDAKAIWGELDNGLRYVILPHSESPHRASLRLCFDLGSLAERDDQQGVAHFLEHMAFNGTKRFAAGATIEYFQKIGMRFGAHTNASTNFDATIYQLELPSTESAIVDDSLRWCRDILDGMTLDAGEVERERGVILNEASASNSADFRTLKASLEFLLPDSLLARRLPIGRQEIVQSMTAEKLREFYENWYSPSRATLVVVGDVDPAMLQTLIERNFSDARHKDSSAEPPKVTTTAGRGLIAKYHHESDAATCNLVLAVEKPLEWHSDSLERQRAELAQVIACLLINTRLADISSEPGSPLLAGSMSTTDVFGSIQETMLSANIESSQYVEVMMLLEQELRRAKEFGFSDSEYELAVSQIRSFMQHNSQQADTRKSSDIADSFVKKLHDGRVCMHPVDEQQMIEQLLGEISKEDCHQMLQQLWNSEDICLFVSGNLPGGKENGVEIEQKMISAFRTSQASAVAPPTAMDEVVFAYTDFGPSGQVVHQVRNDELDFAQAIFENNVRASIKQTSFQKDRVQIRVRVGGGLLEAPVSQPGIVTATAALLISGGLPKHDFAELNRFLAPKQILLSFSIEDDAFVFTADAATADVQTTLQLIAAFLQEPALRTESIEQFHAGLESRYGSLDHTLEGLMTRKVTSYLHGDDPRFSIPDQDTLRSITREEIGSWLQKPFSNGYMEVAIVGDIREEEAIANLAATLGALPTRAADKPDFAEERKVQLPAKSSKKLYHFATDSPTAATMVVWPAIDGDDVPANRRLNVLSKILEDRIRVQVREELGATYSPNVQVDFSDVFPDYGYLATVLLVNPSDLELVSQTVKQIADQLASEEISDDEFQRAMAQTLNGLETNQRDNSYWLMSLSTCHEDPQRVQWIQNRTQDYQSIRKEEIESLAKAYLQSQNSFLIQLVPSDQ